MVIIQLLALWIVGTILFFSDCKNKAYFWLSITMFLCGIGVLLVIINESIIPKVRNNNAVYLLSLSVSFMRALSNYLAPYTFLISAINYSQVLEKNSRLLRTATYLLSIIPFSMFFLFPFKNGFHPSFFILSIWAVPYILTSNLLIIYTYLTERNSKAKLQKLLIAVIFCPPTIISMFVNYILRTMHNESAWRINAYIIIPYFSLFTVFLIKYGFVGIKLKFERMRLDGTIKTITSGTAILGHTLKNEILKISMCMKVIEKAAETGSNKETINENAVLVNKSIDHLMAMFNKIQEHSKDIVVEVRETDLDNLICKSLEMASPFLNEKRIKVDYRFYGNIIMKCDGVHILEVLLNIIKNAVEAMDVEGLLKIEVFQNINFLIVSIQDNGTGIAKENIQYIWDPFFSTKNSGVNLGMGLTYCYNVMQKHHGTIEIASVKNNGTTVKLKFPK